MGMTQAIARSIARDAGNRHARAFNRQSWNENDYSVAVSVYNRLWPVERQLAELRKAA